MASRTSSATAPATAAIGVRKRRARNGATAAAIRRATGPSGAGLPALGSALNKGFDDEIDRSIVQMQTSVGKPSLLWRRSHALRLASAARATAPLAKTLF